MLLGAVIWHAGVGVRITEVEAYLGPADPASHAFRGPGGRADVMFGPPGRIYVYLSYGIHHCVNVVCSPDGVASAVLLRAGEVVGGHDLARARRGARIPDRKLASGPGNLGQALAAVLGDTGAMLALGPGPAVSSGQARAHQTETRGREDLSEHRCQVRHQRVRSGDLSQPIGHSPGPGDAVAHQIAAAGSDWRLEPAGATGRWRTTTRIGISKNADALWRFIIPGDPTVSGRPH